MSGPSEKAFTIFCLPLKKLLRIYASVVIVALILMLCIFFLNHELLLKLYQSSNETDKRMKVKTILYWTNDINKQNFYFGAGDIFQTCEVSACRATHDRNFTKIEDFDALLFHGIGIKSSDLPPTRSPKQKYVFFDLESPVTKPLNSALIRNGFYNWTMTYRRDSDIPRAYGYIYNSVTNDVAYPLWRGTNAVASHTAHEDFRSPGNYTRFEGKQRSVAWFVSHCVTGGLRERYVAELQKYIDVDIYGKCGSLSCSRTEEMECYEMLGSRYYFYLSFENSLCQDYVTEKLYKIMSHDLVPIVYGGANYTEFAPPSSYINVADFDSPKDLAEHLRHLMSNLEEYGKFFWWKKHFFVDRNQRVAACQLCKMLHDEESLASSNISDLNKWWSEEKCQNPNEFLKKITGH